MNYSCGPHWQSASVERWLLHNSAVSIESFAFFLPFPLTAEYSWEYVILQSLDAFTFDLRHLDFINVLNRLLVVCDSIFWVIRFPYSLLSIDSRMTFKAKCQFQKLILLIILRRINVMCCVKPISKWASNYYLIFENNLYPLLRLLAVDAEHYWRFQLCCSIFIWFRADRIIADVDNW